ncbi:hypothetical protein Vadar_012073 [Vaccinium darrowii]|uniref:Uncharacterized protein n=1 Tax=Vaccinium darrowii TaxID=229202 RepID=A0ACB7XQ69_9ERIC|nr:hypothetical protein Vadar_012073 [Vaccinium darrowii]
MSRSKKNTATSTTIAAVPNHITSDILSRLPLNSIFACKRVCKVWRDLTLEPHFAKLHLSRSPLSLIFYRHANYNGDDDENSPSSHFEIFQLHDPPYLCHQNATMKFKTGIYFPHRRIEIVASCNGLILLSNCCSVADHVIAVCNPLRAQHFFLPKPPNLPGSKYYNYYGYGFGHSPATDQYKVVRFTSQTLDPSRLDFDIYTIGIDRKWRTIRDIGRPPAVYMSHLVFLNGAFHWIGSENENLKLICYFDIEQEQFGSFPLPSDVGNNTFPYLGVLDNWLYIQQDCSFNVQKLWVMKDYGDFWSWSLECVIDGPFTRRLQGEARQGICTELRAKGARSFGPSMTNCTGRSRDPKSKRPLATSGGKSEIQVSRWKKRPEAVGEGIPTKKGGFHGQEGPTEKKKSRK